MVFFRNPKKKHWVPKEIYGNNSVVKSFARGQLYVMTSNMIPRILIGVRHLPFLTHQEDITVGRALALHNFTCKSIYKPWIIKGGCESDCEQYMVIHP